MFLSTYIVIILFLHGSYMFLYILYGSYVFVGHRKFIIQVASSVGKDVLQTKGTGY